MAQSCSSLWHGHLLSNIESVWSMLLIGQCLAHSTNSADAYAASQPPALQFVSNFVASAMAFRASEQGQQLFSRLRQKTSIAAPLPPAHEDPSLVLMAWSSFIEYSVCLEHAVYFSVFGSLDQTVLMLMLRIRTTSVESPVLFLHLAACFAERGDLLSAAYDKRQSSIYGRYLSLVSGYLLSNIIFLERAVIGQNGGRYHRPVTWTHELQRTVSRIILEGCRRQTTP